MTAAADRTIWNEPNVSGGFTGHRDDEWLTKNLSLSACNIKSNSYLFLRTVRTLGP